MNFGRVIVEGLTDAYFIHQLICVRFGKTLDPIYDSNGGFRYPVDKDAQDEVFRFAKKGKKDVILEIVINGGSSKLDVLSGLLRDESGATRTMLPCIIFDADYPKSGKCDAKGNGGYSNALSTFSAAAPGVPLYFFPNNQDNGTIETLLKSIAIGQPAYFEECWPAFVGKLRFTVQSVNSRPRPSLPTTSNPMVGVSVIESVISKIWPMPSFGIITHNLLISWPTSCQS